MPHALLAEFCRASNLHPSFLRRCQREFQRTIQPVWDEAIRLRQENEALRAELDAIKKDPPKRPRGRPRKHPRPEEATA